MRIGRLIVVEGVDGAGKSTLVKNLAKSLMESGHPVVTTREPGGTPRAEEIRDLIFSDAGQKLSLEELLEIIHEGRLDHIKNVIRPALEAGSIVISDRFEMSGLVYEVWYDKVKLEPLFEKLAREVAEALGPYEPHYLCLMLDAKEVKRRQNQSGEFNHFDAIEIESIEDRIKAYEYAVEKVRGKVSIIDATQSPEVLVQVVAGTIDLS